MTTTPTPPAESRNDPPAASSVTTTADEYPHEHVGEPSDPPVEPTADELAAALEQLEAAEGPQLREVDLPELVAAPGWRLAGALEQGRGEADAAHPGRDKTSDGTIGDAAHAARVSDHNPDEHAVVRAWDADRDGLDLPTAFERLRQRVHAGELPGLRSGYLILNRRITLPDWSGWAVYTGPNPHITHGHVSASRSAPAYDDRTPWGVFGPEPAAPRPPAPAPGPGWTGPDLTGSRTALRGEQGANGPRVAALQRWVRGFAPLYARHLEVDGWWGPRTSAVLREFAHRCGIASADGLNVGPRLAAALTKYGFRG